MAMGNPKKVWKPHIWPLPADYQLTPSWLTPGWLTPGWLTPGWLNPSWLLTDSQLTPSRLLVDSQLTLRNLLEMTAARSGSGFCQEFVSSLSNWHLLKIFVKHFWGERITLGLHNKSNCPLVTDDVGTGHRARAELSSMSSCFLKVTCYSYIVAE